MAQVTTITITHGAEAAQTIKDLFGRNVSNPLDQAATVEQFFESVLSGQRNCKFDIQVNGGTGVQASGTATYSTFSTAGDTIVINGVSFAAVASGATGNQFNVAASAPLQAINVANAINASVTSGIPGVVTAKAVGSVVTITCVPYGTIGNAITLTGTGAAQTLSGAKLTGGVNSSANIYRCGV